MKKENLLKLKITICQILIAVSIFTMNLPIVAFAEKDDKKASAGGTVTDIVTRANNGLTTIFSVMQGLFTGCATLVIGYVGFLFLFGGEEGKQKGKKQLGYIVAGFALCFLAASLSAWLKSLFTV